jgi:hypothetical protein
MKDKSQSVRIADLWIVAPFLLYAAVSKSLSDRDKAYLLILGFLTFSYNAKNYLANLRN